MSPVLDAVLGTLAGIVSSSLFVIVLFVGFCVLVGLVKLKPTRGTGPVVRSLDEVVTHEPVRYITRNTPPRRN